MPPPSTLEPGTEKGRSPALDDAAHATRGAVGGAARARLAFFSIDSPVVLEIAELAGRLNMVAQGGSTRGDRCGENLADRRHEPCCTRAGAAARRAARGDVRPIEAFARVDIAEPGDDGLIKQRRLDRGRLAGKRARQHRAIEVVAERLGPEAAQEGVIRPFVL